MNVGKELVGYRGEKSVRDIREDGGNHDLNSLFGSGCDACVCNYQRIDLMQEFFKE